MWKRKLPITFAAALTLLAADAQAIGNNALSELTQKYSGCFENMADRLFSLTREDLELQIRIEPRSIQLRPCLVYGCYKARFSGTFRGGVAIRGESEFYIRDGICTLNSRALINGEIVVYPANESKQIEFQYDPLMYGEGKRWN